jgi:hypothetical protein
VESVKKRELLQRIEELERIVQEQAAEIAALQARPYMPLTFPVPKEPEYPYQPHDWREFQTTPNTAVLTNTSGETFTYSVPPDDGIMHIYGATC